MNKTIEELNGVVNKALDEIELWREQQLSFDAGFGLCGSAVGRTFRPWLYSFGTDHYPGEHMHINCGAYDTIEYLAIDVAKELYKAKYVDLHTFSSGSLSSIILCALSKNRDTVMSFSAPLGHMSMRKEGIGEYLGRNFAAIPYNMDSFEIDLDGFEKKALELKPKLILLGSALYLFNEPFAEIRKIADKTGALIGVDCSHTYGVIPCSMSKNPLEYGADFLFGGTYKTVCGPNKGMFCTKSKKLSDMIHDCASKIIYNYNAFLMPALTQALIDLRFYGEEYGCQMIKNAKALARAMEMQGFNMLGSDRDYTDTHIIAAKIPGNKPQELAKKLAKANILCSTVPCDENGFYLRVSTLVPSRRGFKEKDMQKFAVLLADVVMRDKLKETKEEIVRLMSEPERHIVHFALQ